VNTGACHVIIQMINKHSMLFPDV